MMRSFMLAGLLVATIGFCSAQLPDFPKGPSYGKGCGIAGVDPEPRTSIETLIHFKDTIGIFRWLHDSDPVYQAYTVEALIRLQHSGLVIPDIELSRIQKLSVSTTKVYVCSGCTHFEMPMKDALGMYLD